MREAFEQAILDQPDDPASYAAYADWLQEQGDPRGEFIRVQLALEDEARPPQERRALQEREKELLDSHERDWLGELAPYLLDWRAEGTVPNLLGGGHDGAPPHTEHRWRWGFLWGLSAQCLTMAFAQALAAAPAARFLRELRVFGEARYWSLDEAVPPPPRVATPAGVREHWELLELIGSPCLRNLRVFQMGDVDGEPPEDAWGNCHTEAPGLEHVVAGMPRVAELHLLCKYYDPERLFALPNLTRLRVLRVYHLGVYGSNGTEERERYEYPLDVLAGNPALANLMHLLFHPHMPEYHPDAYAEEQRTGRHPSFLPLDQVRALLRSPHLTRLTHLQLRLSNVGDAGVREIIDSGILARLKWLDLRHGCLSDEGARLLAECPDARRLEHLDLSRNAVGAEGLALLRQAGVPARAERPLTPQELAQQEYLMEGDGE